MLLPRSRKTRVATLAAGFLALAAPAAMADSIVYIDGGNVWSASPDGSRKVQLTDGGQWHSPTQADNGTIAAVQGTGPIVVMANDGKPIRTITTAQQHSGDGGTFAARPVDLAFSPDGTKIAYSYVANSCPVASTCGSTQRSTFYTDANVTEATPVTTWGNQYGVSSPSWVTNTRTLVSGGSGSQVAIDDLDSGADYSQIPWMTPPYDMGDPELTRDGTKLAATVEYGADTRVAFYSVNGDVKTEKPPAQPTLQCASTPNEANADPTFSPDGNAVAFHDELGIEVGHFASFGGGDCSITDGKVLSATGSEPDWGPADPPAARYQGPKPGPGPDPQPTPTPTPTITPSGPVLKVVGLPKKVSAKALKKGLKVKVVAPAAGKVTVKLGKAKGAAKATKAGAKVTVKLSKLKAKRGAKLKLVVKQGTATLTKTVKVS